MSEQEKVQMDAILRAARLDLDADVPTLRAAFNETMNYVPVAVEVTIREADSANVVLYLHGGVYVIGSAAASVPLASELARRAGSKAVTVDYQRRTHVLFEVYDLRGARDGEHSRRPLQKPPERELRPCYCVLIGDPLEQAVSAHQPA